MSDVEQQPDHESRGVLVPALVRGMLASSHLYGDDPWAYAGLLTGAIQHPPADPDGHVLDVVFHDPTTAQFHRTTLALHPDALAPDWRGYRPHLLGRIIRLDLGGALIETANPAGTDEYRGQRWTVTRTTDGRVVLAMELYLQWAFKPTDRPPHPDDPEADVPDLVAERCWNPRLPGPVRGTRHTRLRRRYFRALYEAEEDAYHLLAGLPPLVNQGGRPSISDDEARDQLARDGIKWVRGRHGRTVEEVGDRELAEARVTGVDAVEEYKRVHGVKIADVHRRMRELLGEPG